MKVRFKLSKLINVQNIEKSLLYIKNYGLSGFFKKVKTKILQVIKSPNSSGADEHYVKFENHKPSSIWDNSAERYQRNYFKLYWELLPEVRKYQYKGMTGNGNVGFESYALTYIKENLGSRNLRALSIGCTEGNPGPEMRMFKTGVFNKIDVMDIAEGLIKKQRAIAVGIGLNDIEYIAQDLNNVALEENAYDFIWAIGTIHHVKNLELLFGQINNALKNNGIFMMREYVGPDRLQFTDAQLSIINEILSILPGKYKKMMNGSIKNIAKNPDIETLIKLDPSEAIRSKDIIHVIKERLEIIRMSYTGGTILHFLLADIASNFEKDQDAETILKLLIFFERTLIEKDVLPSDYVFCIAKKLQ